MRRGDRERPLRLPAIALLVLGLAHVPLPMPDYHVMAHRHGKGQVCPLHNHLLRWHFSGAFSNSPVLHIHWAFLDRPANDVKSDGSGVHADSPDPLDWAALANQSVAVRTAFVRQVCPAPSLDLSPAALAPLFAGPPSRVPALAHSRSRSFGTTYPPSVPVGSRLQRWVC